MAEHFTFLHLFVIIRIIMGSVCVIVLINNTAWINAVIAALFVTENRAEYRKCNNARGIS